MILPTQFPRQFGDPKDLVDKVGDAGAGAVGQVTTHAPDVINTVTDGGKDVVNSASEAAMSVKDAGEAS